MILLCVHIVKCNFKNNNIQTNSLKIEELQKEYNVKDDDDPLCNIHSINFISYNL